VTVLGRRDGAAAELRRSIGCCRPSIAPERRQNRHAERNAGDA
jgi:hypothetical protein